MLRFVLDAVEREGLQSPYLNALQSPYLNAVREYVAQMQNLLLVQSQHDTLAYIVHQPGQYSLNIQVEYDELSKRLNNLTLAVDKKMMELPPYVCGAILDMEDYHGQYMYLSKRWESLEPIMYNRISQCPEGKRSPFQPRFSLATNEASWGS